MTTLSKSCGLCLKQMKDESNSEQSETPMVERLKEMLDILTNLNATYDTILCKTCILQLKNLADFSKILSCLNQGEHIYKITEKLEFQCKTILEHNAQSASDIKIELGEINPLLAKENSDYDLNYENEDMSLIKNEMINVKAEPDIDRDEFGENETVVEADTLFDNYCDYAANSDMDENEKLRTIETDPPDNCDYVLKREIVIVKPEPIDIYSDGSRQECAEHCDRTYKSRLYACDDDVREMPHETRRRRKKPHKCEKCSYETKYKRDFQNHCSAHENCSNDNEIHKCHVCEYQTTHKKFLKEHLEEKHVIPIYKCGVCNVIIKYQQHMNRHLLVHKNPSAMKVHRTHQRSFQSKYETTILREPIIHDEPSQIPMYQCESCDYITKYKTYITKHMDVHKDPAELTFYKCDLCQFQSRFKSSVKTHMLAHKKRDSSVMEKCQFCHFETKTKNVMEHHMMVHETQNVYLNNQLALHK